MQECATQRTCTAVPYPSRLSVLLRSRARRWLGLTLPNVGLVLQAIEFRGAPPKPRRPIPRPTAAQTGEGPEKLASGDADCQVTGQPRPAVVVLGHRALANTGQPNCVGCRHSRAPGQLRSGRFHRGVHTKHPPPSCILTMLDGRGRLRAGESGAVCEELVPRADSLFKKESFGGRGERPPSSLSREVLDGLIIPTRDPPRRCLAAHTAACAVCRAVFKSAEGYRLRIPQLDSC